jgi:hypothetical protein
MDGSRRMVRVLSTVFVGVLVPFLAAPFIVSDATSLLIVVSVAIVALMVLSGIILSLRLRDAQWRRDAWLVHNAQPRLATALDIAWFVPPIVYVAFGIGWVSVDRDIGLPIVISGAGLLAIHVLRLWRVRRLLTQPLDEDPDDEGQASRG